MKYYSTQQLHKLLDKIPEGKLSQIQFSLTGDQFNNDTFAQIRRINPNSIVIDGEKIASVVDEHQTWPTNMTQLYLKQITSSLSPMMSVIPNNLQILSISNVGCFSSDFFLKHFVTTFSEQSSLVELDLVLIQFDMS